MLQFFGFDFFNWALRLALAQGVILFFFLLNVASFSMPHAGDFKPFFLLMAVYYWAIYRPTVMPLIYTFALGLLMDFQTGLPPGLSALALVGLQTVVQRSRLFLMGQPYVMVWLGFALMSLANAALLWVAASLFASVMPLWPSLIAAVFSVLIFPLASFLLQSVHRVLPVTLTAFRS